MKRKSVCRLFSSSLEGRELIHLLGLLIVFPSIGHSQVQFRVIELLKGQINSINGWKLIYDEYPLGLEASSIPQTTIAKSLNGDLSILVLMD